MLTHILQVPLVQGTFLSTCEQWRSWVSYKPGNGILIRPRRKPYILTIKREVASLNEFRKFFGLKPHDSFKDINPDPEIADLLRKLYDSPDMVELYPGLFVEDAKPRMDPGSGFAAPYTVGRAVLSDAVTLVRADRFNTLVCS